MVMLYVIDSLQQNSGEIPSFFQISSPKFVLVFLVRKILNDTWY